MASDLSRFGRNVDRAVRDLHADHDAAVDRASHALCVLPPEWLAAIVNGDTDRDYPRLVAEAVMRALGGSDGQ